MQPACKGRHLLQHRRPRPRPAAGIPVPHERLVELVRLLNTRFRGLPRAPR